jgi:inorganic triphosphatase YgiF
VRRNGKQRLQTVKAGDGQAVTTRGEWEHAVRSDQPDFNAVRGTPAEKILQKKKIRCTIKPIFETRVTRTTCPVKVDRSLIEVAFDQGEIDTGQDSAPLSEIELELKRGKAADLFQLANYGQGWSSGLVMAARMRWVLDVSFSSSPDQTFSSLVVEY